MATVLHAYVNATNAFGNDDQITHGLQAGAHLHPRGILLPDAGQYTTGVFRISLVKPEKVAPE